VNRVETQLPHGWVDILGLHNRGVAPSIQLRIKLVKGADDIE